MRAELAVSEVDISRLTRPSSSSMSYLKDVRASFGHKEHVEPKDADSLAISYLSIPNFTEDSLSTALLLNSGISGRVVKVLSNLVPKEMVAIVLGISMTNLSNQYKRKSLDLAQTESIVGFYQIWSELMSQFKERNDIVVSWLSKPKRPLGNKAPIELMNSGAGRESVLSMIDRMKTGDFS